MKFIPITIIILFAASHVLSQNYHAVQGSSYAGSLGIANNPASIVNTPSPWDVTLASVQYKAATNIFSIVNYSLLSSPRASQYVINNGDYARYANAGFNIRLFNARIALDRKQAIGFGVNLRGYGRVKTGSYNFIDTLPDVRSFFTINDRTALLEGRFSSNSWMEVFGTYSRTVYDNELGRLNVGLTVKVNRGVSGAYAALENGRVQRSARDEELLYLATSGELSYGYSSNYDSWKDGRSTGANLRGLMTQGEAGLSMDLGIEYLVKPQAVTNFYDGDSHYDYEWKIGVSLLDIGWSRFRYGRHSGAFRDPKDNISDEVLQDRFSGIENSGDLSDSLASIASDVTSLTGSFSIMQPARMVINIDRYFFDDFYVNGELSFNLSSLGKQDRLYSSEMNLLTVTPRWENSRWGLYLPMQYTTEKQFWIGGAFKAGPLLAGVHNLANVFTRNRMHRGGVYLALVIRPGNLTKSARDRRLECPGE